MSFDEYMGMPEKPWLPVSSFQVPATPPSAGPASGSLVQLPCVNPDWLPLILGSLDQLRNPTAWPDTLTESALDNVLSQVDQLRDMFNVINVPCCNYALRFTDTCVLQFSTDSGATWTDVTGWDANFASCVQINAPVTSPPPNPGLKTPDQLSCAIATYLRDQIIFPSMQKAIDDILASRSLLQYGLDIILLLPGFYWSALFVEAVTLIYGQISAGTISDYEAAMTDAGLKSSVLCAIYTAIQPQGKITVGNFPTILTNLAGITYAHGDVVTTLHDYVQKLGFIGLAELAQPAGLEVGEDCSSCGTWCYRWDFTAAPSTLWAPSAAGNGVYVVAQGWTSVPYVYGGGVLANLEMNALFSGPLFLTSVQVEGTCETADSHLASDRSIITLPGGVEYDFTTAAGAINVTQAIGAAPSGIQVNLRSAPSDGTNVLTAVTFRGIGANPFGTTNCT
jgi:hypothetical protein